MLPRRTRKSRSCTARLPPNERETFWVSMMYVSIKSGVVFGFFKPFTNKPDDFDLLQGKMLRLDHDLFYGVRDQFAFLRQRPGSVAIEHESAQPPAVFHQTLTLEQLINLGDG